MPTAQQLANYVSLQTEFRKVTDRPTWVREDVALAQAVLETGWGTSALYLNSRNAYGMSCNSRSIKYDCWVRPSDGHSFAVYAAPVDSHRDYVARMVAFDASNGYSKARTLDEYLQALNPTDGRPRYASESGYNNSLKAVMRSINPNHPELQSSSIDPSLSSGGGGDNSLLWWLGGGAALGALWLYLSSRSK